MKGLLDQTFVILQTWKFVERGLSGDRTGRSFQKKSGLFLCYIPRFPSCCLVLLQLKAKTQLKRMIVLAQKEHIVNCIFDTGGVRVVFVMIQRDEGGLCYDTGG